MFVIDNGRENCSFITAINLFSLIFSEVVDKTFTNMSYEKIFSH